jgi:hypothetical protein
MSKKMGSDRAVSKYLYRSLRYGSLGGYRQTMWWSGMFLIGVDDLGRSIETDYPSISEYLIFISLEDVHDRS